MPFADISTPGRSTGDLEPSFDQKEIWHRHNVLGEGKKSIADDTGCSAHSVTTACKAVEKWIGECYRNTKETKTRLANIHAQRLEFLYLESIHAAMRMEDKIELLEDDGELSTVQKCALRVSLSHQAENHRLAAVKHMVSARNIWGVNAPVKRAATNPEGDGPAQVEVSVRGASKEELDIVSEAKSIMRRLAVGRNN